jgi:transposase
MLETERLGAIDLWSARFHYGQAAVFNASTYLDFLHRLGPHYRRRWAFLIQDIASYHKDSEVWNWLQSNRHWLEVHQLPPSSPELNPTERLSQNTRKTGTHDRYFASQGELVATLTRYLGICNPTLS